MNLGLSGKIALVTGGATGIGAEIVDELRREGAAVSYTTRNIPKDRHGIQAYPWDAKKIIDQVREAHDGRAPDILVNNAGHTLDITDPYCDQADWLAIMRLNFSAPVGLVNAVVPYMKQQKWGRIVNITSCAGLENSGPVTYCVSKAALTAYTRAMGRILATEEPGIVMSAVYPSVIKTEGGHWSRQSEEHAEKYLNERVPTKRFQRADEFSPVVAFYCSQHASACHGAIISADQGQSRHYSTHAYL